MARYNLRILAISKRFSTQTQHPRGAELNGSTFDACAEGFWIRSGRCRSNSNAKLLRAIQNQEFEQGGAPTLPPDLLTCKTRSL